MEAYAIVQCVTWVSVYMYCVYIICIEDQLNVLLLYLSDSSTFRWREMLWQVHHYRQSHV